VTKSTTKSKTKTEPSPCDGYFQWSRDPAVGLFAVLPLWLGYEVLRLTLAPTERNGAEALISDVMRPLGPSGLLILRVVFGLLVLSSATIILRRQIPWLRVTLVTALEGLVYALMMGPLAAGLEGLTADVLQAGHAGGSSPMVRDLVGSIGAGIFEELVFRLILLSSLALVFMRASVAFGMTKSVGAAAAVLLSALMFSLFHHVGPGAEPFGRREFIFRSIAGVVLGILFVLRGFGVCVYTHTLYDLHYYLNQQ